MKQSQSQPDFYTDAKSASSPVRNNTNPRYPNFTQTHFTAGDTEQFETKRDTTNGRLFPPQIDWKSNVYYAHRESFPIPPFERYRNVAANAVDHTFAYMFHKFKKGIYVKIRDGQVSCFLPFSKHDFVNEWSDQIHIDPKYEIIPGTTTTVSHTHPQQQHAVVDRFYRFLHTFDTRTNTARINRYIDRWYANNCLIRYDFPVGEGDTNVCIMSDMFRTLCQKRTVPDVEFFVNRRDFPMLKLDGTEPYNHMYGRTDQKLLSHDYNTYAPILSMVGSSSGGYADLSIPTGDDWSRAMRPYGKYFPKTCSRVFDMKSDVPWDKRRPTAVFRGASTGAGVTIETNPRLAAAYLSQITPLDASNMCPLLDAGITKWNLRPRKLQSSPYLQTIDVQNLSSQKAGITVPLVAPLSPTEQAGYKYILHIDGHVSAYRLSLEMTSGCCLLLVDSPYFLWFRPLLKPFQHFVPVKADLSDLVERIRWCRKNDDACKQIAQNSADFARTYLGEDGVLDYLQLLFYKIKLMTGPYLYPEMSWQKVAENLQTRVMQKYIRAQASSSDSSSSSSSNSGSGSKTIIDLTLVPDECFERRSYGVFRAIEMLMYKDGKEPEINFQKKDETDQECISKYGFFGKRPVISAVSSSTNALHEHFIAAFATNHMCKTVPNFAYIFGRRQEGLGSVLYYESQAMGLSAGASLEDYILGIGTDLSSTTTTTTGVVSVATATFSNEEFRLSTVALVLCQVALALHVAQRRFGFVHGNLSPANIRLMFLDTPTTYEYCIDPGMVLSVTSTVVPILTNYACSQICLNGCRIGGAGTDPLQFSTSSDIVYLLTRCIGQLVKRSDKHGSLSANEVVCLANFLTSRNTVAVKHDRPFSVTGKDGLGDLRHMFVNALQTPLLGSDFFIAPPASDFGPVEIVWYILSKCRFSLPIQKSSKLLHDINTDNAHILANLAMSNKTDILPQFVTYVSDLVNQEKEQAKLVGADNYSLSYCYTIDSLYNQLHKTENKDEPLISLLQSQLSDIRSSPVQIYNKQKTGEGEGGGKTGGKTGEGGGKTDIEDFMYRVQDFRDPCRSVLAILRTFKNVTVPTSMFFKSEIVHHLISKQYSLCEPYNTDTVRKLANIHTFRTYSYAMYNATLAKLKSEIEKTRNNQAENKLFLERSKKLQKTLEEIILLCVPPPTPTQTKKSA